jgi:glutamate synthase (NADPH/NADH) small chain
MSGGGRALAEGRLETLLPEGKPAYTDGEAVAEANRCLYCHDAPCVTACPTGIDIPGFIRKIATGNVRGSAKRILAANLLGYSCARVCPVEVLCVGACVHNHWHREPIAIGRLQRHAVETALVAGYAGDLLAAAAPTGRRVACVGAGPASLAAAGYLALEGVAVTVFDRRPVVGGLNTTGVAPYKMHVEAALLEVGFIRGLGVDIREGVEVGGGLDPAELLAGYDAVFLGVGLGGDARLGIPEEDGPGVWGATSWIERMKLEPGFRIGSVLRAVVIGGGNTAIDVARELAQLGVPDVSLVYRRTAAEMPGYRHELDAARHERVRLVERAVPKEFLRDPGGRLVGVRLADGRELQAELAVVGIGQGRLRELVARFPGIELDERGCVRAEAATGRTGHPKVWAGGDILGGELVVTAVQEGKRAARDIARHLGIAVRPDSPMLAGHP